MTFGYVPAQIRNARSHHSSRWRSHRPNQMFRPRWNRGWASNVPLVTSGTSIARAARLFNAQGQQAQWRRNYAEARGYTL
jgi:hypothetical protein